MRIFLAYLSVVLLWATTPLAIKWSGEGPGFLFAAASRMTIGTVCMLLTLVLLRRPLPWYRKAKWTYLVVAVQIYAAMLAVYWSAQFMPSGWISVVFGIAPLVSALMSGLFLQERLLTLSKFCSYALGVYGLYVMFGSASSFGHESVFGIMGTLLSVILQTGSAVWIKRIDAKLPALEQLTGGLSVALPLYLWTWALADGRWPTILSELNLQAIVYLGVIATTAGFFLYYYLLIHLSATKVSLISLMTPVLALMLGNWVNHEPVSSQTITGTGFILSALVLHELDEGLLSFRTKQGSKSWVKKFRLFR